MTLSVIDKELPQSLLYRESNGLLKVLKLSPPFWGVCCTPLVKNTRGKSHEHTGLNHTVFIEESSTVVTLYYQQENLFKPASTLERMFLIHYCSDDAMGYLLDHLRMTQGNLYFLLMSDLRQLYPRLVPYNRYTTNYGPQLLT